MFLWLLISFRFFFTSLSFFCRENQRSLNISRCYSRLYSDENANSTYESTALQNIKSLNWNSVHMTLPLDICVDMRWLMLLTDCVLTEFGQMAWNLNRMKKKPINEKKSDPLCQTKRKMSARIRMSQGKFINNLSGRWALKLCEIVWRGQHFDRIALKVSSQQHSKLCMDCQPLTLSQI